MLTYCDRDSKPIDRDSWFATFCRPGRYGLLYHERGDGWEVEACWVGVSSSMEKVPCPFLVREYVLRREWEGKQPKDTRDLKTDRWCRTGVEAISVAEGLVLVLGAR